ncbi:MAG: patatin family protein [Clostridia bacterium]|nr:patatin family protein [Clostridia bacterium]
MKEKIGVIDVGGGLRGAFNAGALEYCAKNGIEFDLCIGISAGSANLTSFLSRQTGRNHIFYMDYVHRHQYMSFRNFLKTGSYIGFDYVYSTLSGTDGENPLDYEAIKNNPSEFIVIATDGRTGKPIYFTKDDMSLNNYDICKASCSIPVVCKPYFINGVPCFDGALSDPVPIEKAFEAGCDKVVLLLTLPEGLIRKPGKDVKIAKILKRTYPNAAKELETRFEKYNLGVMKAQKYAKDGKVLIISPDDTCGVSTLSKNKEGIQRLYDKGFSEGRKIMEFLR